MRWSSRHTTNANTQPLWPRPVVSEHRSDPSEWCGQLAWASALGHLVAALTTAVTRAGVVGAEATVTRMKPAVVAAAAVLGPIATMGRARSIVRSPSPSPAPSAAPSPAAVMSARMAEPLATTTTSAPVIAVSCSSDGRRSIVRWRRPTSRRGRRRAARRRASVRQHRRESPRCVTAGGGMATIPAALIARDEVDPTPNAACRSRGGLADDPDACTRGVPHARRQRRHRWPGQHQPVMRAEVDRSQRRQISGRRNAHQQYRRDVGPSARSSPASVGSSRDRHPDTGQRTHRSANASRTVATHTTVTANSDTADDTSRRAPPTATRTVATHTTVTADGDAADDTSPAAHRPSDSRTVATHTQR